MTRGSRDAEGGTDAGVDAALTMSVAAARGADRSRAFADLVGARLDGAYRLAAVILGDPLEAEDAVADAAAAAWAGFGGLRDIERFDAWFGRILVNGCRDRLRRRKHVALLDLGALARLAIERGRGADPAATSGERDEMSRALGRLEPEHQVVLVLRFWLDLPVDAIAERLHIPPGTVKSRLHNAGRRLRQALQDEAGR